MGISFTMPRALFLFVPLFGIVELGLHLVQTKRIASNVEWQSAKEIAARLAKPEDLVIFAPRWAEPLGREHFGEIVTLERAAFADVTRFPRAIEVQAYGEERPELRDWKTTEAHPVGLLDVRVRENPRYRPVLVDFVTRLRDHEATASFESVDGESVACSWISTNTQTGGLGFGTAVPGQRFACNQGSFAGVSIVDDLDYYPRRCIAAPPPGHGALRIRFPNTKLGDVISGHHALYVEAERDRKGAPVTLDIAFGEENIGKAVHVDGEGWKAFEFPTEPLKGRAGEISFTIRAANGQRRAYCFEAVVH